MNNLDAPKQATQKDRLQRLERVTDSIFDKLDRIELMIKEQNQNIINTNLEVLKAIHNLKK